MAASKRRLSAVSGLCVSASRIDESTILISPTKKEPGLPFTPRTYERDKETFRKTEAQLDAVFQRIKDRRRGRAGSDEKQASSKAALAAAVLQLDEASSPKRPNVQQRLQMKIEAARAEAEHGSVRPHKVPLTRLPDGKVGVDVVALLRRSSHLPRPLKPKDVDRVCIQKETALRRAVSAPNFLQRNANAASLRCLRPEVRQRDRAEQGRRRYGRSQSALQRRKVDNEVLRARAFSASQLYRDEAEETMAMTYSSPSTPSGTPCRTKNPFGGSTGSRDTRQDLECALGLRWVAAEAFLGSVRRLLSNRRSEKAMALWDVVVKFVRGRHTLQRLALRWREQFRAVEMLKVVLHQAPPACQLRNGFRLHKFSAQRIQRACRRFAARLDSQVQGLLDGPWRLQESSLLQAMLSACSTDAEIIIGDMKLLAGEAKQGDTFESGQALDRRGARPASASGRPKSAQWGRYTNELKAVPKRPSSAPQKRSTGFQAQKMLAPPPTKHKPGGQWTSKSNKVQDTLGEELQQMIDSAMRQRLQSRMRSHSFLRAVAGRMLRRELLERLYAHSAQTESVAHRVDSKVLHLADASDGATPDPFLDIFSAEVQDTGPSRASKRLSKVVVGSAIAAAELTDADVAEIVLCAHYSLGVRPSHWEVCQSFFGVCPAWRVRDLPGLLAGTLTMRAALQHRAAFASAPLQDRKDFNSSSKPRLMQFDALSEDSFG